MSQQRSDAEILDSLVNDPKYFIERCFSIVNREDQRVPYLLNWVQNHYFQNRSKLDVILKPRRAGFSALISAIFLHACMTRKHTRAVIVSHDKESTKRLFGRIRDFLNHSEIKVKVKIDSNNEMSFPDTESWFWTGTAGSRKFGRGDDISLGHLSEVAFYEDQSVITGVQEALTKNGRLVLETTANGAGTPFHDLWKRAMSGNSEWKAHFYGWWQDPTNSIANSQPFVTNDEEKRIKEAFNLSWDQLAWRRWKLSTMENPDLFPQEFPATWKEAFLTSGAMVFDWLAIEKNEQNALPAKWTGHIVDMGGRIDVQPDQKGPLTIWRSPDARSQYLIVADSAQGIPGAAFSVADVYDIKTWEQVAQWRGHTDPLEFGKVCMRLGAFYGWAIIAVENNYPGNAVLQCITENSYPNIWDEPDETGDEMGFKTTEKSKSQFISDGRDSLRDGSLKINSKATLNEMSSFVLLENGKMGPQPGCWQDTVIVSCKASNILKRVRLEPEIKREKFRDVMGLRRRGGSGISGGRYNTGVV